MDYQLTTKNIQQIIERSFIHTNKTSFQKQKLNKETPTTTSHNVSSKRFTPEEKDAWFWIYYILKYDILQYVAICKKRCIEPQMIMRAFEIENNSFEKDIEKFDVVSPEYFLTPRGPKAPTVVHGRHHGAMLQ